MTATGTIQILRSKFRELGLSLPDDFAATIEAIDTVENTTPKPDRGELVRAYAQAVAAKRDPATDETVLAALHRNQLANVVTSEALRQWAEAARAVALAPASGAVFDALGAACRAAGERLAKAVPLLDPNRPLNDQAIDALTGNAAKSAAWQEAQTAVGQIDAAIVGQMTILLHAHDVVRFSHVLLMAPDVPSERLGGYFGIQDAISPWTLAATESVTIAGATLEDYRAAVERINDEDEQLAAVARAPRKWKP